MKKIVATSDAPAAIGPYSQAIRSGPLLFCAGQIPLDPQTGQIVSDDISEQARRVLENVAAILKAAQLNFGHVVKTTIFLTSMGDFQTVNEIYATYFREDPPARSTVAVSALPKGAKVEIEQEKTELILLTDDDFRATVVKDLIESKAIRRNLSLKIFDWGKVEPAGGNTVKQVITLRRGLADDLAKKLTKLIRDEFPKVKSQIQGDAVRVSGKNKDDLQRVIARLRDLDFEVPLQFQNYR